VGLNNELVKKKEQEMASMMEKNMEEL